MVGFRRIIFCCRELPEWLQVYFLREQKTGTPEELEEQIELLGSNIRMYADREEISMYAGTLSRNFEKNGLSHERDASGTKMGLN